MLTTDGFRLDGKVALVTGSGPKIGRAVAEAFAAVGAKAMINGHRDRATLDEVAAGIRERGGEVLAIMADVADDAAVGTMVAEAVEAFGGLDIVVSNIGIRNMRAFLEIMRREWDDVLRSNLTASFYLSGHVPFIVMALAPE
jgi:NAD(P)-dependent dehydrogenase (short-subunit alcohol dehydrogenase family)